MTSGPSADDLRALRDPLCRAEIALSQLERNRSSVELLESVRSALGDLDARIAGMLRRHSSALQEPVPVTRVIEDVLRRVRPVLDAARVELSIEPSIDDPPIEAPDVARRALLSMLRTICGLARRPARVSVGWKQGPRGVGLRVSFQGRLRAAASYPQIEAIEDLLEREGIAFEFTSPSNDEDESEPASTFTAWLPIRSASTP